MVDNKEWSLFVITKPQKYTREFVLLELKDMHKQVLNDLGVFFIGQLFENRDYSRQRFSEWSNVYKKDSEISDIIKRIEELLETRLVTGGLTSALNPTLTIFTLKNKHSWKDKNETDLTSNGETLGAIDATRAEQLLRARRNRDNT